MKSIVAYVRNLLGWCDEDDPANRTSLKRDRTDDDVLCDEAPALKRLKQLKRTSFPDIISSNDPWEKKEKNVRYVPIQVETGHPSTSTPIELNRSASQVRSVPVKLVDVSGNGPATPSRKPRMHTPVRPVMRAVVDDDDDDDDDEEEVTWVESKPTKSQKPSEVYIDLEDDDQDQEDSENDVIFVKKVSEPPSAKPYKLYVTKNDRKDTKDEVPYYRLRKLNDRKSSLSPRSYTSFKAPAGIMKTYKKTAIPPWLQPQKPSNSAYARSRLLNVNGSNIRSTLSEVFNLDEKRKYQELIRKEAEHTRPISFSKPIDIVNIQYNTIPYKMLTPKKFTKSIQNNNYSNGRQGVLSLKYIADDSVSFRNTQKAQRKSLNEIRLVEKGLIAEREGEASKEYDPITVASINSSDSELEVVPSESSTSSSVKIDPINTYTDSHRDKDITSTGWLAKIDSKYRKKRQETQEKWKDARRESDIIPTLSEVCNLDEKRNYQELIRKEAGHIRSISFSKPIDIVNIADDSASFRNTKAQRKSLNEIRLVEKGLIAEREGEASKEYDPITVASINSSDSELEVVPSESSTSSSVKIDPINTLKDSYRDKDITSTNRLAKIDSNCRKKRQETQEKLKDARRESDIISKVNYEQNTLGNVAHLEHKLSKLSIPESLIEEAQPTVELPELTPVQEKLINRTRGPGPAGQLLVEKFNLRIHRKVENQTLIEEAQPTVELPELTPVQEKLINRAIGPGPSGQLLVEKFNLRIHRKLENQTLIEEAQPTVELPELTPEQKKLINRAIGPGPAGQLLVEKFNLRIHRRDLQTLSGLNWLNDEVINFYMNLLMQRSEERRDLPKVYATNTFFYPKLMQSGQAGLRRWTRKVDIFAHDLMVVPVHLGVHWCLSLVDFRCKRVQYLDSMGGRNQPCLDALLQYLRDEHRDKKGQPFDEQGWKLECLSKDIPQQMNGSDCGMFACTFAEFSARNAPYSFSQTHMPYLRRKAALEILMGRLLL